jgi:uncharacterized protein (DUF3820 family)
MFDRFDFGKYKGKHVRDVPDGYLRWCLRDCDCLGTWLRRSIEAELRRRANTDADAGAGRSGGALVDLPALIRRWHAEMSLLFHPDRGGSTAAMQAINHGADRLKEMAGVA